MKLRRVAVHRLPGIDTPFALPEAHDEPLDAGVCVVVGPNAIGKSSLCRAVEALLWREGGPDGEAEEPGRAGPLHASAAFEEESVRWWAERDGPALRWQREGVDAPPPSLPGAHLRGCFFLGLRELLELTPTAGREVAKAIRRELAGGFDLRAVAEQLVGEIGPRFGYHEKGQVEARRRALRDAVRRHEELARRRDGLAELEARCAEAEAARARLEQVGTARELRRLREALARVEAELAALPPALERLTGSELEEARAREGELEERERERDEAERRRAAAAREAEAAGLAEPLGQAALRELEERVRALDGLERELAAARRERRGCEEACARARRDLGGRAELETAAEADPDLDPDAAGELFAFLRRAEACGQRRAAAEERIRILEAAETLGPEKLRERDRLRRGVERLRVWLRAPEPAADGRAAGWGPLLVAALGTALGAGLVLGAGAGLGAAAALLGALLAGLGVGAGAELVRRWWARGQDPGTQAREVARREFPTDLAPPAEWHEAGVASRLAALEDELADLEARIRQAHYRDAERTDLEARLALVRQEEGALVAQREELARRLGLEALAVAELVDAAERLARLREARRALEVARGAEAELVEGWAERRAELEEALASHGASQPRDAAAAAAAVSDLCGRSEALRRARERETAAAEQREGLARQIERLREARAEIYRRAALAPGDAGGLARLLDTLDRYRELRREREELRARADQEERRLAAADGADLARRDAAQLEAEEARLGERAGEAEGLRRQIADVNAEVRAARQGHALEEALTDHTEALEALRERREARLRAEAGRFLLDEIERDHEASQQPRVLERARRLFAAFTHHRYELRVAPEGEGSFVALEAETGAGLRPDQLSDGTRAQLVLAARLAFAEEAEAEAGTRLPLFLDEALDHSDPARFDAIARSLGRMVSQEGGRQVVYLTTEPADAERLGRALAAEGAPPPRVIDLAAVRGRAAAVPGPEALRVPPLPVPPSPEGHDAESYGAALGVPPLDPARGVGAQHLLHLLWDDVPLLHRLLVHGIEWVGQWQRLAIQDAPLARELRKAGRAGGELDTRAELLEVFCAAWGVGRGRPVDREALQASGVVSETFMEGVVGVARDLGGDAERLIEALRERSDERLKGFRSRATQQLRTFLEEKGYLDGAEPLSPEAIRARLLATPAAARLPEGRAAECCHRWTRLAG